MRLDIYICEKNNIPRNKAKSHIKNELVSINGTICTKPGTEVKDLDTVYVKEEVSSLSQIPRKKTLEGTCSPLRFLVELLGVKHV